MKSRRPSFPELLLFIWAMSLPIAIVGCGASNPNENEFLSNAPPGAPGKEENYGERRARTHTLSKIELKQKAAAEKAAAAPEKAARKP